MYLLLCTRMLRNVNGRHKRRLRRAWGLEPPLGDAPGN